MKKAIIIKAKTEEGKTVITGNLVAINEVNTEKAKGFIAVIGNGEKEYVKIGFFNNDKTDFTERAEKSKLKNSIGKPITMIYRQRGDLNLGITWEYIGSRIDTEEEGTCVYFARVGKIKTGSKGQAVVSLAVRKGKETEWNTISFFNTEKFKLADNVQKYLKAGDSVLVRADNYQVLSSGLPVANGRGFDKIY